MFLHNVRITNMAMVRIFEDVLKTISIIGKLFTEFRNMLLESC